ncbi:MAG TPA: hypothetical protein VNJ51_13740, partial [Candidatus Dormibacteraeota bacterium]|nr:hypothetical protein [Candidatus Dormibacteraeota bacterium]
MPTPIVPAPMTAIEMADSPFYRGTPAPMRNRSTIVTPIVPIASYYQAGVGASTIVLARAGLRPCRLAGPPGHSPRVKRTSAFTLVELLIAAGISIAVTAGLVLLLHRAFLGAEALAAHRHAYALAEDLSDRWQAEAASAFAVFIPASDVLGGANADGHEVDFFTRDGQDRPLFWAYRFDASLHVLQRYTYAAPGALAAPSGEPLSAVTSFAAATLRVDAFTEPIFAGHARAPVTERLGYPGVAGGNAVTELHLVTSDDAITADVLPGVAPSGFTIVVGTFTPAPVDPGKIPVCSALPAGTILGPDPNQPGYTDISSGQPCPVASPLSIIVDETWYTNQYKPCRPNQNFISTATAAQGTIQQILAGQSPENRGPGNVWWNDVVLTLQDLLQNGTPSTQPV